MKATPRSLSKILGILLILPELLSATCSSKSFSPADSRRRPTENDIAWLYNEDLSTTKSTTTATTTTTTNPTSTEDPLEWMSPKWECVHGTCSAISGQCECDPCWNGPTCSEYIDRFSPRFLADDPFFIIESTADSAEENSEEGKINSNEILSSFSEVTGALFRIETADDDLGFTCQLGQEGPAATCPCATPRYRVIGQSASLFRADEETGDVFPLSKSTIGLLTPRNHYPITLQVSALEVNASGYIPWRETIKATIYVRAFDKAFDSELDETSILKEVDEFVRNNQKSRKKWSHFSPSFISRHKRDSLLLDAQDEDDFVRDEGIGDIIALPESNSEQDVKLFLKKVSRDLSQTEVGGDVEKIKFELSIRFPSISSDNPWEVQVQVQISTTSKSRSKGNNNRSYQTFPGKFLKSSITWANMTFVGGELSFEGKNGTNRSEFVKNLLASGDNDDGSFDIAVWKLSKLSRRRTSSSAQSHQGKSNNHQDSAAGDEENNRKSSTFPPADDNQGEIRFGIQVLVQGRENNKIIENKVEVEDQSYFEGQGDHKIIHPDLNEEDEENYEAILGTLARVTLQRNLGEKKHLKKDIKTDNVVKEIQMNLSFGNSPRAHYCRRHHENGPTLSKTLQDSKLFQFEALDSDLEMNKIKSDLENDLNDSAEEGGGVGAEVENVSSKESASTLAKNSIENIDESENAENVDYKKFKGDVDVDRVIDLKYSKWISSSIDRVKATIVPLLIPPFELEKSKTVLGNGNVKGDDGPRNKLNSNSKELKKVKKGLRKEDRNFWSSIGGHGHDNDEDKFKLRDKKKRINNDRGALKDGQGQDLFKKQQQYHQQYYTRNSRRARRSIISSISNSVIPSISISSDDKMYKSQNEKQSKSLQVQQQESSMKHHEHPHVLWKRSIADKNS